MQKLPNSCTVGKISVFPKNWETGGKSLLKKEWRIDYRFYDPRYKEKYPRGYPKRVKGMNTEDTLEERRALVRDLLANELNMLMHQGYNPITKTINPPKIETPAHACISNEDTLLDALEFAYKNKKCAPNTLTDLRSVKKYTGIAAKMIGYDQLPIGRITRAHIKVLLNEIGKIKKEKWTNNNFNYYRAHLLMLWNVLDEFEVGDPAVVEKVKQMPKVKKVRKVLTNAQRLIIDRQLKATNYRFWLVVQIFFHSGIRRTELCRLQAKDVNLDLQEYTCLVLKGGTVEEIVKPIKDIAVPFWEQALKGSRPDQYIFSNDLLPGDDQISPRQITRRWKRWVKEYFRKEHEIYDIADFYSLKHSNSDEVSDALDLKAAQRLNGHKKDSTTRIYAINEKDREMARIRSISNEFAPSVPA